MNNRNFIQDALLGIAVGDALGVPVEFVSRGMRADNPVTGMRDKGSHNQPAGTWSDDTSLTLCLAEMLCGPYSLKTLAGYFIDWKSCGYCTAHGHVFDIGITTSEAIYRLAAGTEPALAGGTEEHSNGNGSLMRILPLVFLIKDMPAVQRFNFTKEVSSLTHGHIRSVIACFVYLEYARLLIKGYNKFAAYEAMRKDVTAFLQYKQICHQDELNKFHRVLELRIGNKEAVKLNELTVDEIDSSGYVISTLEASLWCILQTNGLSEAVLKAVNLGDDTDTTGAVTGGLAGLLYGTNAIPKDWLAILAKHGDIEHLAARLNASLMQ